MKEFAMLGDLLHFQRTAERLWLTQSALSKQIQRLEAKLGGLLLIRAYRRVTLTPAGTILRDRARSLLREAELAEHATALKEFQSHSTSSSQPKPMATEEPAKTDAEALPTQEQIDEYRSLLMRGAMLRRTEQDLMINSGYGQYLIPLLKKDCR